MFFQWFQETTFAFKLLDLVVRTVEIIDRVKSEKKDKEIEVVSLLLGSGGIAKSDAKD